MLSETRLELTVRRLIYMADGNGLSDGSLARSLGVSVHSLGRVTDTLSYVGLITRAGNGNWIPVKSYGGGEGE
jgi:DNA-binding MarR family transcriptional regulator